MTNATTCIAAAAAAKPSDRFVNTEQQLKALLATNPLSFVLCFYFFLSLLKKEKKNKALAIKTTIPGCPLKSVRSCWSNIVRQKGFLMPLWNTLKPRRCNLERKRGRTRRRRPDRSSSNSGCSSGAGSHLWFLTKVIKVHGLWVFSGCCEKRRRTVSTPATPRACKHVSNII